MKAVIRIARFAVVVATLPLSLWMTYESLAAVHESFGLGERPAPPPPAPNPLSPPNLSIRAGDGDARLIWSVPSDMLPLVEQWEFEQSKSGTVDGTYSTGSNATSYLVTDLTNGATYSYRVRAILKAGSPSTFGSWSNTVSATPMQVGDVLDRMERHQHGMERHQWSMARQQEEMAREQGEMARRQGEMVQRQGEMVQQQGKIADGASSVAAFVAENGKVFRGLADRGIMVLDKLVEASGSTGSGCADCPGDRAAQVTHNIHHTTFAFRFAPPWFGADHRSLFTSYVVFPEEAKFEDWIGDERGEICEGEEAPPSVCPETAFYEKTMGSFLEGVSHCATTDKVELHLVGFASATGLKGPLGEREKELEDRYKSHIDDKAELCKDQIEDETNHSNMFNLLIANERAANAADMLREIVPTEDAFIIKAIPWCSHAAMVYERDFDDDQDPIKGLMNRRVEVHLAVLPNC